MSTKTLGIVAIREDGQLSSDLQEKLGGESYCLYVYDPKEVTHLAEITPSYCLIPFGYAGKKFLSDEDDGEYRNDIIGNEPVYMHCRSIDALHEHFKTTVEVNWDDDEDVDFETQAYELMSANPSHPSYVLSF